MAAGDDDVFDGHIVPGEPVNSGDGAAGAGLLTVRFVHYPGAQQLIIWLPQSGYQGYGDLRLTGPGGLVESAPVRDRLNGSVQILWNTLGWPPGSYRLEIDRDDGVQHRLGMTKLEAGAAPPEPAAPEPEPELFQRDECGEIIYRDGAGNVLPNADLDLREKVLADMARRFNRRLEFEGTFRGGTVHYIDSVRRIAFWHEMAGGGYHMMIDIPAADRWEAATGTPLAERDEIVRFVAEETRRVQAPSWNFEITATDIRFY